MNFVAQQFAVGTSGWSYPAWKDEFYPRRVPQRKFLEHYATRFSATELNVSFYRLPSEKMIVGWLERTPTEFRFCVKLSRLITHLKRLKDCEAALITFLDRFKPLRRGMGPVLAQLPPSLVFDHGRVSAFLAAYRRHTRLPLAVEARHKSWFANDAWSLLAEKHIALVQAHSGGRWPATQTLTADFVYLRFHGPGKLYASGYTPQMLGRYATRIAAWLEQGYPVWAFFNNTDGQHAWRNAEALRGFVDRRLSG